MLADWAARLGQDLFYPPNVGGWPGGRTWISTRAMIGRANYAAALVEGRGVGRPEPARCARAGRTTWPRPEPGRCDRVLRRAAAGWPSLTPPGTPARGPLGPDAAWGPDTARRARGADPGLTRGRRVACTRHRLSEILWSPHAHATPLPRNDPGGSSLIALSPTVPGFLARTARAAAPERDGRVLVVVQLDGGNDGINTVVPYADEGYARHRKALRLATDRADQDRRRDRPAPGHAGRRPLLEVGRLAIVPGRGLSQPEPVALREHGDLARRPGSDARGHKGPGWLGRALRCGRAETAPRCSTSASGPSRSRCGAARSAASALDRADDFLLDPAVRRRAAPRRRRSQAGDDTGRVRPPQHARRLCDGRPHGRSWPAVAARRTLPRDRPWPGGSNVARLLKAGLGARVYLHGAAGLRHPRRPAPHHAGLSRELSGALAAFLDDLAAAGLAERVAILGFSEFGRRVAENGSAGTDHGTAARSPGGPGVRAGLLGAYPSLTDLEEGDLKIEH